LVGLVLLVVLGSAVVFYFNGNRPTANGSDANFAAQGTTQATHATATAQAIATANTIAQVNASATVVAQNPDPYPPYNWKLALLDPLIDNSKGYDWTQNNDNGSACMFTGGAFHVTAPVSPLYHGCAAQNTDFSNFDYEVQMSINAGDCGAIFFRGNLATYHYYYFRICQDGSYDFLFYNSSGQATRTFANGNSPAINAGLGQSNTIGAVANNNLLAVYVNHQLITSITDNNYSAGQIGVFADNDTHSTEVTFSDAKVWIP
jgi:hypothetical protein